MIGRLIFSDKAWNDYLYFMENDKQTFKKINALIKDIKRTPFEGTGKPEPLKFGLQGKWSRRITSEHRLVYTANDIEIEIIECRYHYNK